MLTSWRNTSVAYIIWYGTWTSSAKTIVQVSILWIFVLDICRRNFIVEFWPKTQKKITDQVLYISYGQKWIINSSTPKVNVWIKIIADFNLKYCFYNQLTLVLKVLFFVENWRLIDESSDHNSWPPELYTIYEHILYSIVYVFYIYNINTIYIYIYNIIYIYIQ
jgi:hypothetical protein